MVRPIIEVAVLAIIPLILLASGVIPSRYRFVLLGSVALAVLGDSIISQTSLRDLGLRTDNLLPALAAFLGFALLGLLAVIAFTRWKKIPPVAGWRRDPHLLFWFIPVSIVQQFVFFAFILPRLNQLFPIIVAVVINAAIFASAHLMYRPKWRAFTATFLAGVGFSLLYLYIPNLIAGSLAHMALNYTVVRANLFDIPNAT